jgi:hypothetical protein
MILMVQIFVLAFPFWEDVWEQMWKPIDFYLFLVFNQILSWKKNKGFLIDIDWNNKNFARLVGWNCYRGEAVIVFQREQGRRG